MTVVNAGCKLSWHDFLESSLRRAFCVFMAYLAGNGNTTHLPYGDTDDDILIGYPNWKSVRKQGIVTQKSMAIVTFWWNSGTFWTQVNLWFFAQIRSLLKHHYCWTYWSWKFTVMESRSSKGLNNWFIRHTHVFVWFVDYAFQPAKDNAKCRRLNIFDTSC